MKILRTLTAKNLHSRGGQSIKGIVLHDTAGSGQLGDAKYLANDPENRGISVDFCIIKDGSIYQLNSDLTRYYTVHAGRKTNWRAKGLVGPSVNKRTVGIEIAQKAAIDKVPDPKYPFVQVTGVAEVCAHLCKMFNLTKVDITTHKDIITDGSRSDPRHWPWVQFWDLFNQAMGDSPVGGPNLGRITHVVQAGETLYSLSVKYNSKVEVIKALNNMNTASNTIIEGQTLTVKE
jgi:N-acetyl-anhydromuramyl-L-alanine amidase AmpD